MFRLIIPSASTPCLPHLEARGVPGVGESDYNFAVLQDKAKPQVIPREPSAVIQEHFKCNAERTNAKQCLLQSGKVLNTLVCHRDHLPKLGPWAKIYSKKLAKRRVSSRTRHPKAVGEDGHLVGLRAPTAASKSRSRSITATTVPVPLETPTPQKFALRASSQHIVKRDYASINSLPAGKKNVGLSLKPAIGPARSTDVYLQATLMRAGSLQMRCPENDQVWIPKTPLVQQKKRFSNVEAETRSSNSHYEHSCSSYSDELDCVKRSRRRIKLKAALCV